MDEAADKSKQADPNAETVPARAGGPAGSGGGSAQFFAGQASEPDPKRIGKYRIHHRLGSGGMGLVYLATRDDDQFNKRVAIKIIKKGMDSEAIVSRFEQERQVLAALNHPNIARLLDGGLTEDGRPYFVMEYVEGLPIDDYCDNNRLSIEDRLELFRALCQAVHHAHTNLIVHRDLKPGNVIVTPDGSLKLLDFGIAKLLNPGIAVFSKDPTQTFLRLMTPEYASPEQVRGDPISTASDVYSLGVVLYELVTGRRPYEFKTRLQNEIERIICNEDPEKPSTAITHVPDEAGTVDGVSPAEAAQKSPTRATTMEEIAKVRHVRPDRLRRLIAGDLDNMIMMAMRKEPRRRYASAEQFAEDIKRHLTGLPVIARPATWNYQFSKFVRRNKGGVGAVAAIIAVLVIGIVATMMQTKRAMAAEQVAKDSQIRIEQLLVEAVKSKEFAKAMEKLSIETRDEFEEREDLASELFFALNEDLAKIVGTTEARNVILHQVEEYLRSLEKRFGQNPSRREELADGYGRLGDVLGGLRSNNVGSPDEAIKSYSKSRDILESLAKERPNDRNLQRKLTIAHVRIGDMHWKSQHNDQAMQEYKAAMAIIRPVAQQNPGDLGVQETLATVLNSLSDSLVSAKQFPEARLALEESLQTRQRIFDESPYDPAVERRLTTALTRLSEILVNEGRLPEAMKVDERVLDIRQRLWESDKDNTQRIRDLAYAHLFAAQNAVSAKAFEKAAAHYRAGIDLMTPLAANDAANVRYQSDLGHMYVGLAGALDAQAVELGDMANMPPDTRSAVVKAYEQGTDHMRKPALTNQTMRLYLALAVCNWGIFEHNSGQSNSQERLEEGRKMLLAADPDRKNPNTAVVLQSVDKALGNSPTGMPGG